MSRIEKALKKAIAQHDLPHEVGQSPADLPGRTPDTASRSAASNEATPIALMAQGQPPLSPEQRAALKIVSPELNQAAAVKAFRELRTKIGQRVASGAVIMVTGVEDGAGSSFTALNLAVAIAFDSTRTALLVDCNLRAPTTGRLLNVPSAYGLTDYLDGNCTDVAQIIHAVGIERLRVVPAGRKPDQHSEYFTLEKTRRLICDLATRYPDRQTILDVPPIASSADAQILAGVCDHILVVVPYARVTEYRLQTVLKSFDAGKLLGIVLNDEPTVPPLFRLGWFRKKSAAAGPSQK